MTYKTFNGGAIIPYGAILPAANTTPDGSLFYKTVDSVDGSAGLYFFGLLPDNNPSFGDQPSLGWVRSISTQIGADTLGGLPASAYQQVNAELSALINQSGTGFYVRTGVGTSATRTLVAGSTRLSISNPAGVTGNPTLDVVESNLSLANIGGTLPVSKGGTGTTSVNAGSIVYSTSSTYGLSGVGAVGQVLLSGGTGAPTWTAQSSLSVGSASSATTASTATSAGRLSTARSISATGDASWTVSFDGQTNVTSALTLATVATAGTFGSASAIPIITVDQKGRVTGVSTTSVTASTANSLATSRTISASGDASWSVSFNGSQNVSSDLILNTVNANAGTFGSSTLIPQFTVDGKGRVTSVTQVPITTAAIADTANQLTTARTIAATGDASWSVLFSGAGNVSSTLTLDTVNSNTGSFGSASAIPVITVDGKGRITAVSTQTSISANTANSATAVALTTSTSNSAFKVPFANTTANTTGNYGLLQDSASTFTYNPSTDTLTVGKVVGDLTGTADKIDVSATTSADTTTSILLVANQSTGSQSVFIDSGLLYNANTDTLTVGTVSGNLSGNASTATSADSASSAGTVTTTISSTNSAFKVPFANTTLNATGNYGLLQDSGSTFTYNPSTNTLTVGTVVGDLVGNADTATKVDATTTGTNSIDLVTGKMADSDAFRIRIGGTAADAGFAEIATDDGGNEPIYIRQYNSASPGSFTTITRTATILDSSGNTTFPGNVTAYSDINLKTDLEVIPDALEKVSQLSGYTYTRKDTGSRDTGLVAQEVQKVLPEAVIEGEHLSLAYGNIVGLLVEAIKELKAEIESLKAKSDK